MKTLAEAVQEAGPWLERLQRSEDEVDVTILNHWGFPPLSLGTVRALYALGADIARCAGLFTAEDLARAINGGATVSGEDEGLRALFKGLCQFHGVVAWDEERAGPMPADFYLPTGMGAYVVIAPEVQDRQVEISALRQHEEKFIVLDREDLGTLLCHMTRDGFLERLGSWMEFGTHAGVMRRNAGMPGWS